MKVCIGPTGGPDIRTVQDRWGRWIEHYYEPEEFFYVDQEFWRKLDWWQTPIKENLPLAELSSILQEKLRWSKYQSLLQFNAIDRNGQERRFVAALSLDGKKNSYALREWTLYERTIGYQLSRLKAWILSRA